MVMSQEASRYPRRRLDGFAILSKKLQAVQGDLQKVSTVTGKSCGQTHW